MGRSQFLLLLSQRHDQRFFLSELLRRLSRTLFQAFLKVGRTLLIALLGIQEFRLRQLSLIQCRFTGFLSLTPCFRCISYCNRNFCP